MAKILWLNDTNSDLSGGADFNKEIGLAPGSSTVGFSIAKNTTETSYAFSPTSQPNNADWPTGSIYVYLYVTTAHANLFVKVQADRLSAAGAVLESSSESSEQNIATTGAYLFTIPSKDWTAGAADNRLRIRFIIRNSSTTSARSGAFSTVATYVITYYPNELNLEVQKKTGDGSYGQFSVVPFSDGSDTDTGPFDNGITYYYKCRKILDGTAGDYSPEDYVTFSGGTSYTTLQPSLAYKVKTISTPTKSLAYKIKRWRGQQVVNGGFETGDQTGWTDGEMGGVAITSADKHTGIYSCKIYDSWDYIEQVIDLTDVSSLTFWWKGIFTGAMIVYVGGYAEWYIFGGASQTTWKDETIDVSGYSGQQTVRFELMEFDTGYIYLDDISAISTMAPTKAMVYEVVVSSYETIQKDLVYKVKSIPSAITKDLTYKVRSIPSTITKDLDYLVKFFPSSITKDLDYLVKSVPAAITKDLDYLVKYAASAISKDLDYLVKYVAEVVQSTLDYKVATTQGPIQKGLVYAVYAVESHTIPKTLDYKILKLPVAVEADLDYLVKFTPSTITKDLAYRVQYEQTEITKDVDYLVQYEQTEISKDLVYTVPSTQTYQRTLAFKVATIHPAEKDLVYTVPSTSSIPIDLDYKILRLPTGIGADLAYLVKSVPATVQKDLAYEVLHIESMQKGLEYVVQAVSAVQKGLTYCVLSVATIPKDLDYLVLKIYSTDKDLDYFVSLPVSTIEKPLAYKILKLPVGIDMDMDYAVRIISSIPKALVYCVPSTSTVQKGMDYVVQGATSIPKSLKYCVPSVHSLDKTLSYKVLTIPSTIEKILAFKVFTTTEIQKTLSYKVLTIPTSITKGLTYKVLSTASDSKDLDYLVISFPSTLTKDLAYKVLSTPSGIAKDIAYKVLSIPSTVTKTLAYKVLSLPSGIAKDLAYAVALAPTAVYKTLTYKVLSVPSTVEKDLYYEVLTTSSDQKTLAYKVLSVPSEKEKALVYVVLVPSYWYTIQKDNNYLVLTTPTTITKGMVYVAVGLNVIPIGLTYCVPSEQSVDRDMEYVVSLIPPLIIDAYESAGEKITIRWCPP